MLDYYAGYSTGYSAGYVAARQRASVDNDCALYALTPSRRLPPIKKNGIYAVSQWMYRRLSDHVFSTQNVSRATHLVATYDDASRALAHAFASGIQPHKIVILDFAPGCRALDPRLHRVRLETSHCRARRGYDILVPHTASRFGRPRRLAERTLRDMLVSFWGHLSRPYIDPPRCMVRYRLWRAMRDERDCDVGAYDVEGSVNAFTTSDPHKQCNPCSYACKTCYYEPFSNASQVQRNQALLTHTQFLQRMRRSKFCVAARGDNPGSPKLGESILSGCVPLIVMDQDLPFERHLNYSAFSIRFRVDEVLRDPSVVLRTARGVSPSRLATMQRALLDAAPYFDYHDHDTHLAAQDIIIDEICGLP